MTLKNYRAPLLTNFKLCASFCSHWWIQTGVTVRKRPIWVKITIFFPCDLEIRRISLKNNKAPFLPYFKLCASFSSHSFIQTGVTVRKHPIWIKSIFCPFDLEIWRMTLKNNRARLLWHFKLCASFRSYMWIQSSQWSSSPEMAKLGFDLCDIDLWPLAWTSHHFCQW